MDKKRVATVARLGFVGLQKVHDLVALGDSIARLSNLADHALKLGVQTLDVVPEILEFQILQGKLVISRSQRRSGISLRDDVKQ